MLAYSTELLVNSLQKLLAFQSHGNITGYIMTWAQTTETQRQTRSVAHSEHHAVLSLDTREEYTVTVTAWNIYGSSLPSTITTPRRIPGMTLLQLYSHYSH